MDKKKHLRILSEKEIFSGRPEWRNPGGSKYFAMYSSVFGGVVTDPALMVVPLDDHMVHRGDGIFEAFKCVNGCIYNLDAHLARLERSAQLISLMLPFDLPTIKQIIVETVAIAGKKDCMVRVFVSRGLGGFDCAPGECHKSNLYVVVVEAWDCPEYFYTKGVSAITSKIPIKPSFFARVKSCNYLPNALVDMEAEENGVDFAITLDEEGNLAEGATENVAVVTKEKVFMYPEFDRILKGTSLLRGVELARELIKIGILKGISQQNIPQKKAYESSEMLIFSTGPDVVPVVSYDGRPIGSGKPGPVFRKLLELFQRDVKENKNILTPVF
ncbi:aminodeoxychorismate lyase [Candidatus Aerophobetes bacterium]|uniref:Aminodeoxychorismate lyase n=1 Tax=Aerophobetes bacterium TaxID=2030807 RepID=A0A662DEN8_UNCAE|nr:MAG: aminodeoxychorismate lyase [Candidatus Aerophobetes bacterium]